MSATLAILGYLELLIIVVVLKHHGQLGILVAFLLASLHSTSSIMKARTQRGGFGARSSSILLNPVPEMLGSLGLSCSVIQMQVPYAWYWGFVTYLWFLGEALPQGE